MCWYSTGTEISFSYLWGVKSKRCASNTDCLSICAEEKYATPMRMKRTVSVVKFWDGQLLNPRRKKEKSWFLTKTANYVSPLPTSILKSCTKTVGAAKTFAAIFLWMIRHISSAGISMPGILTLTPNCWNQEYCIIQVIVFLSDIWFAIQCKTVLLTSLPIKS